MSILRDIITPRAPINGTQPISVRELVARYEAPLMDEDAPALAQPSPFSIAERDFQASTVKNDVLSHMAGLHKYGRRPHAEAVAGLLDNFHTDGNRHHLNQAIEILEHLRTL